MVRVGVLVMLSLYNTPLSLGSSGDEEQLIADYDQERQIKPRTKDEIEEDEKKKQAAYLTLIDQLGDFGPPSEDEVDAPGRHVTTRSLSVWHDGDRRDVT